MALPHWSLFLVLWVLIGNCAPSGGLEIILNLSVYPGNLAVSCALGTLLFHI